MKDLFVPYELALKLKKKRFDEECIGYWWDKEWLKKENRKVRETFHFCLPKNHNLIETRISAPLYQQVIDWLFNTHRLEIFVRHIYDEDAEISNFWQYYVITHDGHTMITGTWISDKYIALDKAIEEALKLI